MPTPTSAGGLPALFLTGVVTLGGPSARADDPGRPGALLTVEDLYRLEGHQALRLAPDGRRAAYARQWVDPDTRRERLALWVAEGDGGDLRRPLEPGEPDA